MKLLLIHLSKSKKLEVYEIQENKVIPVLLYGTHNNFYELAENTRNFIRVDESASVEL